MQYFEVVSYEISLQTKTAAQVINCEGIRLNTLLCNVLQGTCTLNECLAICNRKHMYIRYLLSSYLTGNSAINMNNEHAHTHTHLHFPGSIECPRECRENVDCLPKQVAICHLELLLGIDRA